MKIVYAPNCPVCGKAPHAPYRAYDGAGNVVQGCVDDFHTGHLVTPSGSSTWHARKEANHIRTRLAKIRDGYVSRYAEGSAT